MSRPRSDHRKEFTTWVSDGGKFTMGKVAKSFGWSIKRADDTLRRARLAGEVVEVEKVTVPGAKRPVAVYQSAAAATPGVRADVLHHCMRSWAR